jgi:hypothetical protein
MGFGGLGFPHVRKVSRLFASNANEKEKPLKE